MIAKNRSLAKKYNLATTHQEFLDTTVYDPDGNTVSKQTYDKTIQQFMNAYRKMESEALNVYKPNTNVDGSESAFHVILDKGWMDNTPLRDFVRW